MREAERFITYIMNSKEDAIRVMLIAWVLFAFFYFVYCAIQKRAGSFMIYASFIGCACVTVLCAISVTNGVASDIKKENEMVRAEIESNMYGYFNNDVIDEVKNASILALDVEKMLDEQWNAWFEEE